MYKKIRTEWKPKEKNPGQQNIPIEGSDIEIINMKLSNLEFKVIWLICFISLIWKWVCW